jgi:hypothetical protein
MAALRFNDAASISGPSLPQSPDPPSGSSDVGLDVTLAWGPREDECDPLEYDLYFGTASDPPFVSHVSGAPILEVGKLDPLLTYYWRVEVIDTHGNRTRGPEWSFTTVRGIYPDTLPPSPPIILDRLRRNPAVPLAMLGIFITAAVAGLAYWRRSQPESSDQIPIWYSTGEGEEE